MPFMSILMVFLIWVLQLGYKAAEKAFKESSIKAEQALSSIKVVAAFGQEAKEEERF
jgi:ABC-type multidrug transport system fused ATPase/permease subunit